MAYLPSGRLNAGITGNTAGASSLLTAGTMYLAGGNNVTLSQNGSTISFSAAGAAQASINFSASNASANLASVNFANGNNVSFALTNGSQIVGSASFAQSAQTQNVIQALVGGTVAQTANTGTVTFANANGVTFGMSNNNVMTASVAAAAAGSNTIGASGGNVSGNVGTVNGSNFSYVFAGGNNITLSQSITSNSATLSVSAPSLVNGNGFSFGSNAGSVTASYTGNAFVNISASGSNANYSGLTFANANSITFGLSNGVVTASAAPDGIQAVSAGTAALTNGTLSFSNANNINFGLNGSVLTASANVAGGGIALANSQTTYTSGTAYLSAASGAISIGSTANGASQSFNFSVPATSSITATNITLSTNGNTIGFSAAPGLPTLSRWEYPEEVFGPLGSTAVPQGSLSFQHMYVPFNITATAMKIGGSVSIGTANVATTGTISASLWMGIYTLNGSTLSLATSASQNNSFVVNNSTATTANSNFTGLRQFTVSTNSIYMSAGEYWIAAAMSTNTNYASNTMALTLYGNSLFGTGSVGSTNAMVLTPMGSGLGSARDVVLGQGLYTAVTSAGPTNVAISLINNTASAAMMRAAFYNVIYNATY